MADKSLLLALRMTWQNKVLWGSGRKSLAGPVETQRPRADSAGDVCRYLPRNFSRAKSPGTETGLGVVVCRRVVRNGIVFPHTSREGLLNHHGKGGRTGPGC